MLPTRSARQLKSGISENVLRAFSKENVTIASATSEIVGFPPLRVEGLKDVLDALQHRNGDEPEPG